MRASFHPYDTITHLWATERGLLIGTTDTVLQLRARDIAARGEAGADARPKAIERALLDRVERLPDADALLARIATADRLGRRDGPVWTIWAVVLLCVAGTIVQLAVPMVEQVGSFMPELFARGEHWRAVTAHGLHELGVGPGWPLLMQLALRRAPIHLAVNVLGLLVLGHLVERPLGRARTVLALFFSGVGTIAGVLLYGHLNVLGASGLVAGLAGAMLALELHCARGLPAYWRIPRRLFVIALVVQFAVVDPFFRHVLAGGAHLGGFAGGYLATRMLTRRGLEAGRSRPPLRVAAGCAAALVAIGVLGAVPLARHEPAALERHARRLVDTPAALHLVHHDNAAAWLIATEGDASAEALDLAVALADRAVAQTGRMSPDVLDTLAEALFQQGDAFGAVLTIDEAIRLAPGEPYFVEQRRRFTGERDADDRPPPPGASPREALDPVEQPDGLPIDPRAPRVTI